LNGKKIEDEESSLGGGTTASSSSSSSSSSSKRSRRSGGEVTTTAVKVEEDGDDASGKRRIDRSSSSSSSSTDSDSTDDMDLSASQPPIEPAVTGGGLFGSPSSFTAIQTADSDNIPIEPVPRANPLEQGVVPPEVVFFGEPRNPPPGQLGRDTKYHGSLLYWARHSTVAPRTSEERQTLVFPKGRLHPQAPKYRLSQKGEGEGGGGGLSFDSILQAFLLVQDDLEASKAFLDSNIDLVSPKLFLRLLTAEKLSAQSKRDVARMSYLKDIRNKYILAHDQLFFPLNIEIQKAETRVMTYLARPEIQSFARDWDSIEMTLHFTTLLAARFTWDDRVREILDGIKRKVDGSIGYMAEGLKRDLMSREFRKPGITAELYLNASIAIEKSMPQLYSKIKPEVQLLHETYFMLPEEIPL
jgi:hypothetical protein